MGSILWPHLDIKGSIADAEGAAQQLQLKVVRTHPLQHHEPAQRPLQDKAQQSSLQHGRTERRPSGRPIIVVLPEAPTYLDILGGEIEGPHAYVSGASGGGGRPRRLLTMCRRILLATI